jgi:hypothetical protein
VTDITLREGDVFRFDYSPEEYAKARGDLRWCFDGQLVVRGARLVDTYWGLEHGYSEGRSFTLAEAQARGTLTYVCNLSEVEPIRPDEYEHYADGDAFTLSHQNGCYKHFVKTRGAKKSVDKVMRLVHRRIDAAHEEVKWAALRLEYRVRDAERVEREIAAGKEPLL